MVATTTEYLSVIKLQHIVCGVYIWEWVTSLGYELDFYTGRRPWRWTLWVYLLCRYCVLGAVINLLVVLNAPGQLACLTWAKFQFLFTFTGVSLASLLIALRSIAIWGKHPLSFVLAGTSILAQLAVLVRSIIVATAVWEVEAQDCVLPESARATLPVLATTFAVDLLLLLLMLSGLLRKRDARRFGIWRFLWAQGLLWLALAVAVELPTVVILALNFNGALGPQVGLDPES
ncbi:hypothetical protein PENSPDRAFT_226216 [Peniophora sp. CONT]|nr:hypothetical protein PENSPDRAFT_226216 [Peniophora sp. CONT]